jgi:xylan 1,4-beta-xylosidase
MSYNLLPTGVRLHKLLEGLSDRPLLRRTMATLSSGIGIDKGTGVYREGSGGEAIYDFTLMDQILDVMTGPHTVPFFGVGFMPEPLSKSLSAEQEGADDLPPEARTARGAPEIAPWKCPPRDYDRWRELARAVVSHCVERYGEEPVAGWYWDFWNEPDLRYYWAGSAGEFMKAYDYAAAGIRDALPSAKVGGCGPANPSHPIFRQFLEHCTTGRNHCTGETGAPLDFITFHMKGGPTGKLGEFSNPWAATDYEARTPSLSHIIDATREAMEQIASLPGTEGLPVFLTECDIDWGTGTSIYHNPNMHYRNSEYFAAFQCALISRMLDLRAEFPDNPIQACFLDTFYFPGYRLFEGQRTLITDESIEKPILNALRLLARLGPERLGVDGAGDEHVDVVATRAEDGSVRVMAVNFAEPFDCDETRQVEFALDGLADGEWRCRHWRIDRDHSNAYTAWLEMGRPNVPDESQPGRLEERQGLETAAPEFTVRGGPARPVLRAEMPPHSVSLWELSRA